MANPKHLAILKKGVKAWNEWRERHPEPFPDLRGLNLPNAKLSGMNLAGSDLTGVELIDAELIGSDLTEANLHRAILIGADLSGAILESAILCEAKLGAVNLNGSELVKANLTRADLSRAFLNDANLSRANLSHAILGQTNFRRALLRETNFADASIYESAFIDVDLSRAKGLETARLSGPSTIGIDTIYKSRGKIPHVFLRGAGVPENFIEYMASLVGTGIEFYSLFISYSTHDQEFADRLHADLQAKGVRCWFAPHKMQGGKKVHEQIDEAIRVYDKLLLILSPDSMASEWVKTEVFKAREREIRENRRVLFPIRLCSFEALRDWKLFDADTGKDLAREIREYFIPDFSNWTNPAAYSKAFDRLLKDLHGKAGPATAQSEVP
ncbi:MAG: toll/interleukin-1 receptor domain-containing protein [Terracidiphilus sp.]|jgi:uncharacterized protein YjbI with pentapeptide repeats